MAQWFRQIFESAPTTPSSNIDYNEGLGLLPAQSQPDQSVALPENRIPVDVGRGLMADDFSLRESMRPADDIRIVNFDDAYGPQTEAGEDAVDLTLKFAQGTIMGSRMLVDAFGADSEVSKSFRGAEKYLDAMMSAGAREDKQAIARLAEQAKNEGVFDQLVTGFEMLKVDPAGTIVQALGTSVPVIAGTVLATLTGGTVAGLGVGLGLGATQGSGIVKGAIYETVKQELLKIGMPEQEAESRAVRAQEWGGENTDQILTGAGITALGAITGLESAAVNALIRKFSQDVAKKTSVQAGTNIGLETVTEGAQGFQEQTARNIATQRQGDALGNQELSDTPTTGGAYAQGVMEAGAGMGAATTTAPLTVSSQEEQAPAPLTTSSPNYGTVEIKSPKGGNLTVSTISAEETELLAAEPMMARRTDTDEFDEDNPENPIIYSRISRLADNEKFKSQLPQEATADEWGQQLLRWANRGGIDRDELVESKVFAFLNAWERDFKDRQKISQEKFLDKVRRSTPQSNVSFIVDRQGKAPESLQSMEGYDTRLFNHFEISTQWQSDEQIKMPSFGNVRDKAEVWRNSEPTRQQFIETMEWLTNAIGDLLLDANKQDDAMRSKENHDQYLGTFKAPISQEMRVEMNDRVRRLDNWVYVVENATRNSPVLSDYMSDYYSKYSPIDTARDIDEMFEDLLNDPMTETRNTVRDMINTAQGIDAQLNSNPERGTNDFIDYTESSELGGNVTNYVGLAIAPKTSSELSLMQGGSPFYQYHGSFSDRGQRVFSRLADVQDVDTGEIYLHIEELQSDLLNNDLGIRGENPLGLPSENQAKIETAGRQDETELDKFNAHLSEAQNDIAPFMPVTDGNTSAEELLRRMEAPLGVQQMNFATARATGMKPAEISGTVFKWLDSLPENQENSRQFWGLTTKEIYQKGSERAIYHSGFLNEYKLFHADALRESAKTAKTVGDFIEENFTYGELSEDNPPLPRVDFKEVDGTVTITIDVSKNIGEEGNPNAVAQIIWKQSEDPAVVPHSDITIKQFGETIVIPTSELSERFFDVLIKFTDSARPLQKLLDFAKTVDYTVLDYSNPNFSFIVSPKIKALYSDFLHFYSMRIIRALGRDGFFNVMDSINPKSTQTTLLDLARPPETQGTRDKGNRSDMPEYQLLNPLSDVERMARDGFNLDTDQELYQALTTDYTPPPEKQAETNAAKKKAEEPTNRKLIKMWMGGDSENNIFRPESYSVTSLLEQKYEKESVVKPDEAKFVPNRNRLYTQMLQRVIAYAVDNGYDGITVSDPQSHINRWSDDYQKLYNDIYGKRIPNTLRKLTGSPLRAVKIRSKIFQPEELAEDGKPSIDYVARNRIDPMYADRETDAFGERIAIKLTPETTARIRNQGFQFARQGETPAVGVSTEQAVQAAQDLAKRLNVAEDIRISISEGELAEGVKGAVLGDGHIIVSAQAHASIDDIKQTILHEMVGHYGIRRILSQGDLDTLMTKINLEAQRSPEFRTQIEEVRKRGYDEGDPMVFVEEVLAMMAETEMSQFAQLKNDIVAIFTRLMRALGINTSAITKAEVLQLLGQSKRALQAKPESDSVVGQKGIIEPANRQRDVGAIPQRSTQAINEKTGLNIPDEVGGNFVAIEDGKLTDETLTNQDVMDVQIGVNERGLPRMSVDQPEAGDSIEAPSKEMGRKFKINMFKRSAGWNWIDAPAIEGDFEKFLVSVETTGKHFYTLEARTQVPTNLTRYPNAPSEPRLRPTGFGEVQLGEQIGKISVRGKEHPVYATVVMADKRGEVAFESRRREGDRAGYFDMTKENVDANIRDAEATSYYGADQTKGYFVRMPIDDFLLLTTHEGFTRGGNFYAPYTKDKILEEGPSTSNVSDNVQNRFDPEEVDRPNLDATPFLILRDDEDESGNPIVKVAGHEGRHRAALASAEGATTMPVFIRYEDKLIFDFEENKARGGKQDFEDLTASREVVGQFDETRRVILPKGVEATYSARERAYDIMTSRAEESELGLEPAFLRKDEAGLVSSSLPTAKKPDGDALKERLIVGFDRAKSSPDYFKKITTTVKGYGNWKTTKRNPNVIAEEFIDLTVDNLLYLYDSVPESIRDRSKLWYVGANKLSSELADKYDFSVSQVAGVMAAMSPQKDWYQNYRLGELVIDAYQNGDKLFDQAMSDWLTSYKEKKKEEERKAKKKKKMTDEQFDLVFDNILSQVNGRSLAEVDGKYKAHWIRAYVEANLDRRYRIVEPEGTLGDFATTQDGAETNAAFGSMSEIFKAVSILLDGSLENISGQLGDQHKVRSFYNNILMPMDDQGDVTIDTHAVAAALLLPFSASSTEVLHNFGGGAASTQVQGLNGTYPLYAEGYRRAARQRDVLPREMQSVTWEAVRGLFPRAWKSKENLSKSRQIWLKYKTGGKSLDEVRNEIVEFAGGVRNPDWAD